MNRKLLIAGVSLVLLLLWVVSGDSTPAGPPRPNHAPGTIHGVPRWDGHGSTELEAQPIRRRRGVKVFDVVSFMNEIAMYEIRVGTMWHDVDVFLVVEANTTFQGNPKECLFHKMSRDPANGFPQKFLEKVRVYNCGNLKGETHMIRENSHRRCQQDALIANGLKKHDIVHLSDADEIVDAGTLGALGDWVASQIEKPADHYDAKFGSIFPVAVRHRLWFYNYRWYSKYSNQRWQLWYSDAYMYNGDNLRMMNRHYDPVESYKTYIGNGYHCSWCFRTKEEYLTKMKAYGHDELRKSPKSMSSEHIKAVACEGKELFSALDDHSMHGKHNVKLMSVEEAKRQAPPYLVANREKFKWMLPEGTCDVVGM